MKRPIPAVTIMFCVVQVSAFGAAGRGAGAAGEGLCVHVPATDGRAEVALARGGRRLVHGLALDDAALRASREAIRAAGLHPLASVERAAGLKTLPYADNLVNLLVADLDALGAKAPPREEVLRVLVPRGTARLKRGGRWTRLLKPVPAAMDDWTHFDHGPEGNGVSADRLAGPPTFVQWISGETYIGQKGHPSRRVPPSIGVRVCRGRMFYQWEKRRNGRRREVFYGARDGFNGLPLWNLPHDYDAGIKRFQFLAAGKRVYAFLKRGEPLAALDAASGEVVRTYDQGCRLPAARGDSRCVEVRCCRGRLIQTCGNELFVLDAETGRRLWRHREREGQLYFPVATAGGGKVFVAVAGKPPRWGRWPHTVLKAIVCLDLADGGEIWRNTAVAGGDIGQLVYDAGSLAVFGSGAIGGGDDPYIGNIRVADGKLLFHRTFKKAYNRFGYNMLVRDGVMYYCDHLRIYAVDMASGAETRVFDDRGYNQRCNRFSATPDWFIYGLVTYVDRSFIGRVQSVTRSGCATGAFPAHGLIYFTPNGCGCIPGQLRGHMALSPEPLREAMPDDRRLEPTPAGAVGAAAAEGGRRRTPAGIVADDWVTPGDDVRRETRPVAVAGDVLVAVVHAHRLERRGRDGKVRWAYVAGGRIPSPPVVHDGLVLFASHDGYVYCLRAADGAPRWRFCAAPYRRKMIAHGQLESSWPVCGVTMHDRLACFSAGRHPEIGGGIFVYGVEPKTGRLAWKRVLRKPPIVFDPKKPKRIVPNRVLNDVLRSDGERLHLPGVAFGPGESAEAINERIVSPPLLSKKARRGE